MAAKLAVARAEVGAEVELAAVSAAAQRRPEPGAAAEVGAGAESAAGLAAVALPEQGLG